jgi:predicted PurR-regulated permease PerM
MPKDQTIIISTGTILRTILLLLGVVFLYYVRDVVAILLVAVVIASAIEPGIKWFCKRGLPRVIAVLAIYLATIALLGFLFYLVIPPTINQLQDFVSGFPLYLESTLFQLKETFTFLPFDAFSPSISTLASRLDVLVSEKLLEFFSLGSFLFDGPMAIVFAVIIAFYLSVQEDGVGDFLRIVTPYRHESYLIDLWGRSQYKIGRWFQGQILLGVLVGVLVYLGLTLLGVKYALVLGVVSATFEIIPYFGPIMAAIPGIAISVVQSPVLGLWVVFLYVMVQQLENHLIYPVVVRKTVGVPPLLVIVSLLIGAKIGGFFGVVLAVPLAVVLVEFLNDVAEKKKTFQVD